MSDSNIRLATDQDLPMIKQVIDATALFPSEYLDDMFTGSTEPGTETGPDQEFWLTYDEDGAKAVGYCAPERMTNGTWNLLLIAVHPDRQGAGIGRQMMSWVENKLRTLDARVLLVETSGTVEFTRTRSFYEHIGYTQEARIRDYYDKGDDKIVFYRAL
jgi:ribosomal protein S18 acetylase RimI-like enzyme